MSPKEENILDSHIKGVNLRSIWAIIITTAVCCSTCLSIYFSVTNQLAMLDYKLQAIERRLDKLEDKK